MRLLFTILVAGLCAHPSQEANPQFRAGTQRVLVDVTVTTRRGEAVGDLGCGEFRVTDNGTIQKVLTCEFFAAPGAQRDSTDASAASDERGRPLIILVDDYNLPVGRVQMVRDQLSRFIRGGTNADDLTGLYYAGESASDGRLTIDRDSVATKLSTLASWQVNAAPPRTGEHVMRMSANSADPTLRQQDRARLLLYTLRSVSQAVGSRALRRARMVLVSPGFPHRWHRRGETILPELEQTVDVANRSNVTIHAVDPSGMRGFDLGLAHGVSARPQSTLTSPNTDALSILSLDTGGLLLLNRNDLSDALRTAGAAGESLYVLAYETNSPPDGKYHRIEVEVQRERVEVRARRGYIAR
jgi:VWFA-related protein